MIRAYPHLSYLLYRPLCLLCAGMGDTSLKLDIVGVTFLENVDYTGNPFHNPSCYKECVKRE